ARQRAEDSINNTARRSNAAWFCCESTILLIALDSAQNPKQMDMPGWQFHPLKRDLAGHYAVSVNGNWRITFTFKGEDAEIVDYQDYH
ncbi:MAG: type II toxin-antitoxin system RelE/ParE family toxin, partial [Neisseriaceae bacterium]|nr:type II toxin-antitoxin system RelE/ParE family toxin [Neisseriaceae bacterium]